MPNKIPTQILMPIENLYCPEDGNTCQYLTEIAELRREVTALTELVRTDALTGLYNFRFFKETLGLEMERTRRGTQPLSMIMVDIDHFKRFNDRWGHENGNLALVHVSNLIKDAVRKLDFPCRFGGEEFAILLPNTDVRQAILVAERLHDMIASAPLLLEDNPPITITASLGVDQFTAQIAESSDAFTGRVDAWLYQAKHKGRNQVAHPDIIMQSKPQSVTTEEKDALFNLLNDND